ncbi:MAG: D-serine deaminase-like pyridoxal phosphate-dependent protein, partial [Gammaproteobacteria bacterium]
GKLAENSFKAGSQVQWLVDTPERLEQYQALAHRLNISMRINCEIDVGLHRGGLGEPADLAKVLDIIDADPDHLAFTGLMGYEPHLTGMKADLEHPAVQEVLNTYRRFVAVAESRGIDTGALTLNGGGSHTLGIYHNDDLMNDLSAGSGIVKPIDFDTYHLSSNVSALFIATPILKRYDELKLPGDPAIAKLLPLWNPNMQRVYYIYGGYWKAKIVSPEGVAAPIYQSTNQSPVVTSNSIDLRVDDYIFFRPTQSEHVMLQFGDVLVIKDDQIIDTWPVFHQTG